MDGVLVIDGWADHLLTTFTADVPMTAGDHTVVEYYERFVDAVAQFAEEKL